MMRRVASMPSMPGIIRSIVTRSGRSVAVISTASAPVEATPMTRISGSELSNEVSTSRVTAESSTMRTRTGAPFAVCVVVSDMKILPGRAPDEAPDRIEQLALIELALHHIGIGAYFESAAAVVNCVARGDNNDRNR